MSSSFDSTACAGYCLLKQVLLSYKSLIIPGMLPYSIQLSLELQKEEMELSVVPIDYMGSYAT